MSEPQMSILEMRPERFSQDGEHPKPAPWRAWSTTATLMTVAPKKANQVLLNWQRNWPAVEGRDQ
jgi:hypothetical protein